MASTRPVTVILYDALMSIPLNDKHRIAIVGFTEHWKLAPFEDPSWHIWCMNNFHTVGGEEKTARADAWFNLHGRVDSEKDKVHTEWAKDFNSVPYVTLESFEEYPHNVVLPVRDLVETFNTDYFTNSVSYLIAYAMWLLKPAHEKWVAARSKLKEPADFTNCDAELQPTIGVWGVDMAATSEYGAQRPSCEYFIGLARGLGYKVDVPDVSDLLKSASMYGLGDDSAWRTRLNFRIAEHEEKKTNLEARKATMINELGQIDGMLAQLMGAIGEDQYWRGVWTQGAAESTRSTDVGVFEGGVDNSDPE